MSIFGSSNKRWASPPLPPALPLSCTVATLALLLTVSAAAQTQCTPPPALQTVLSAHPTVENAVALGNWFAGHQQFGCAVDVFRQALKSDPESAQLHYLKGLALSEWGHTNEAIPDLEASTRLEPSVIKPHLVLASLYQKAGRPAESIDQWKQALAIDPHSELALTGMSDALMAAKNYSGVVALLKPASRTEPLTLKLVQAYAQLNMLDAATQAATDALRLSPKSIPLANAASVVLVRQAHYQEAVKLLEHTRELNPGNREAEVLFFRILVLTNDIQRAAPMGKELLAQQPHNPELLYLNGVIERDQGNYALSKTHLEESVHINPGHANARYNLGLDLVYLKEWAEAKEQLEKSIALGAVEPQAHFELSKALRALGEDQRAQEESQKYVQLKRASDDALQAGSLAAQSAQDLAAGKTTEAIPNLEESVRLNPKVVKTHLALARLYDNAARHADAEEQWKQALAIDPHATPALEGLAADLLARKAYAEVVDLLQPGPRTESLAIDLSQAYGLLNQLDQAKAVLTEALKASPRSLELTDALTVVLVKQNRFQEATSMLEQTVKQHPNDPQAQLLYLRILVATGDFVRAKPIGPKLLAVRPHDAEVLYLNGILDREANDYAKAKAHLEEAVSLEPDFFNSRYNLGVVLNFLHEWKEAEEQLKKAEAISDTRPSLHFELAKALHGLGDNDNAAREQKLYLESKKTEDAAQLASPLAVQGDQNLAAGNWKEAINNFRQASDAVPANPEYKYKLSIALDRSGDLDGERAQLESAISIDPTYAAAQNQLGYLLSRSGDLASAEQHFHLAVQSAPNWTEAWINYAATLAGEAHLAEARNAVAVALRLEPQNAEARELSNALDHDPSAQPAHP